MPTTSSNNKNHIHSILENDIINYASVLSTKTEPAKLAINNYLDNVHGFSKYIYDNPHKLANEICTIKDIMCDSKRLDDICHNNQNDTFICKQKSKITNFCTILERKCSYDGQISTMPVANHGQMSTMRGMRGMRGQQM